MTRMIATLLLGMVLGCGSGGAPPPKAPTGAAGSTGVDPSALPPEKLDEVNQTFRDKQSALNGCYRDEIERTKNMNLVASVTVKVHIGKNGDVLSAEVTSQEGATEQFQQCVVETIGKFSFPQLPDVLETSWPYQFRPNF